jgi:hypothetical protein
MHRKKGIGIYIIVAAFHSSNTATKNARSYKAHECWHMMSYLVVMTHPSVNSRPHVIYRYIEKRYLGSQYLGSGIKAYIGYS